MNRSQFAALYDRYGGMVFRRAKRILGNDADAEDVVQEVFGLLLERGITMDNVDAASSWFYRTTTNRALNVLRSRSRRQAREQKRGESLIACLPGSDPEAVRLLRELLSDLHPPVIAEAAYYFYLEQMTLHEIALVLDVTRRTVANYLATFRTRVQSRIGNTPTP